MDASTEEQGAPVDLTSCDREPIHVLGTVQPFGFLLAVSSDWILVRASANAQEWLGRPAEDLLGLPLDAIVDREAIHLLRGHLQTLRGPDAVDRVFGVRLVPDKPVFDIALHVSGGAIIIEAEPSAPEHLSAGNLVRNMVSRLQQTAEFEPLCREAARQMRALTGFDRVMVYRFAPDGSGEVIAEAVRSGLDRYLGLHYPASDIPKQARALYERNWLRIIADIDAPAIPVIPPHDPAGEPLDLSLSTLRTVSSIHLEYLRNMGVAASLSVSILRDGRLWGLFACHHTEPRHISLERRTAAELFGQMFSWILESREREVLAAQEALARETHNRLMSAMASGGAGLEGLADFADELSGIVACDGLGLWVNGEVTLQGMTPTREEFTGLVRFLNRTAASRVYATDEIGRFHEPGRDFNERAAGMLAVPVSRTPRDFLVFFRKEVARTVTWAGNPEKPASLGPNGVRLTPRKSFEAWREVVHGRSLPWTDAEARTAEALRVTLLEVILRLSDSAERERKEAQERQELLIAELLTVEAAAYLGAKADRVVLDGVDVLLEPQAFTTMALVVHELMTNSAKYGALSDSGGRVDVRWERDGFDSLVVHWTETGGPAVKAPTRRGFGSTIIERSVPYELKGEAEVRYALTGLAARLSIPAAFVRAAPPRAVRAAKPEGVQPVSFGGTALVVEDNMIIALEAEEVLSALGADAVDMAASVREALRLIDASPPDRALLDVNLGAETSVAVARRLAELGIPFAFATGYGESFQVPPDLGDVPVIKKPYGADSLRQAFGRSPRR
ncbi:GAF domain-containing protein [Methylobacterium sp. 22177]|uniref:GAF domain-containing protein n=1 Tax=Methylobacterium sp. 22177 TaxID=3453885 RepID=UPI003F83768A